MAVNGTLSGASTGTTNFTAYVNPYTVINNGNQMSKHIYVGTQRIMSKLCDAGTMADPTKATKATYTGSTLKYDDKYTALTKTVKARYDSLGVAYNGVDNKGVGFYKSSKDSTSVKYFYHSDQLGSANYITDETGSVSQHLEYIPYGETFVDERYNNWHTPYVFNGKERDEETGLTYYGSRYSDGNGWLSRDPRQLETPNIGSYVFCHGNPVNRVDPDGEFSTKLGAWVYSVFHGGGSIYKDKINGQYFVSKHVAYTGDGVGVQVSRKFGWGDSQNGGSIVTGGNASQGMGGTAKHLDPTIDMQQLPIVFNKPTNNLGEWLLEAIQKTLGLLGLIPEAKKSATPKAEGNANSGESSTKTALYYETKTKWNTTNNGSQNMIPKQHYDTTPNKDAKRKEDSLRHSPNVLPGTIRSHNINE